MVKSMWMHDQPSPYVLVKHPVPDLVSVLLLLKGYLSATAYIDLLDNSVLPNLWEKGGEGLHMAQMTMYPHTCGHIDCIVYTCS